MTTLLTILVFLTVFVEVLLIAAFFRTGSGEKDVAKRLAAIMADVTEEAAADTDAASVLVSQEEPEGFKGRLTQTVKRVKADCDAFGWGKNLGVRIGLIALGSFLLAMAVGRMTAYPFLVTISCGVVFFAVICSVLYLRARQIWSADTLERLASTLRDRAELALKVQAKTSEARASIKIVSCLVPGVLIYQYIQAPADFHFLVTDPTGLKVLFYAAASVAAGLLITWAMVRRIQ